MSSIGEIVVDYVGEGLTDAVVAQALIRAAGGRPGVNFVATRRGRGKDSLDKRLGGLNKRAFLGSPVLALRDLDRDAPCPAALIAQLLSERAPLLCLRIPVRSIEAWLIADRDAFANAIGVRSHRVPAEPDRLTKPKDDIIQMARASNSRTVRDDLVPRPGSGIPEGPALGAWLSQFAADAWNPKRAVDLGGSPSLSRAFARLTDLIHRRTRK